MNHYEAIMATADEMEARPNRYDFWASAIPAPQRASKACALALIGRHLGMTGSAEDVAKELGYAEIVGKYGTTAAQLAFYEDVEEIGELLFPFATPYELAPALRKYARKRYKSLARIPDSVRAIFSRREAV